MIAQIITEEMIGLIRMMPTMIGIYLVLDLTGSLLFGKR